MLQIPHGLAGGGKYPVFYLGLETAVSRIFMENALRKNQESAW
jgi:hypothetical protein